MTATTSNRQDKWLAGDRRRTPRLIASVYGSWVAKYAGGPYIDVYHTSRAYPLDVINVWDYGTEAPTIPFNVKAVHAELLAWLADNRKSFEDNLRWL